MWKDALGLFLVAASLGGLALGVASVGGRDYVGAALLLAAGVASLQAATGLLRPTVGE